MIHAAAQLLVPLHDIKGKCRRGNPMREVRRKKGARRLFTYDDVAVLEAMEQAFGPSFEMLLAAEQREISVQKLAHELRVPITAFNAILERMQRECDSKGFEFRFNHFNEAVNYVDLMNRLSKELDFVRKGASEAVLVFQETRLESGVVAPAIRFIAPLIRKRGFKRDQVTFREIDFLPPVMIDGPFISQVLFNLLENAIKYFPKTRRPADFRCVVEGKLVGSFVEIHVTDNGHPIPEQDRERVFDFGFRGDHAKSIDSDGAGLGLWISRAVVQRHGGALELRIDSSDKNVFVIRLPGPESRPQVSRRMPYIRT
jgi:signal transduction histidine kinase